MRAAVPPAAVRRRGPVPGTRAAASPVSGREHPLAAAAPALRTLPGRARRRGRRGVAGPDRARPAAAILHRPAGSLYLHRRQLVEIARALHSGARLFLLDEPTANFTFGESTRLFAILRRLARDEGLSTVLVSHRMNEIRAVADVCTVIRDGRTNAAPSRRNIDGGSRPVRAWLRFGRRGPAPMRTRSSA